MTSNDISVARSEVSEAFMTPDAADMGHPDMPHQDRISDMRIGWQLPRPTAYNDRSVPITAVAMPTLTHFNSSQDPTDPKSKFTGSAREQASNDVAHRWDGQIDNRRRQGIHPAFSGREGSTRQGDYERVRRLGSHGGNVPNFASLQHHKARPNFMNDVHAGTFTNFRF